MNIMKNILTFIISITLLLCVQACSANESIMTKVVYETPIETKITTLIETEVINDIVLETGTTEDILNEVLDGEYEIVYPYIGTYIGMFENNKRNGVGTFVWLNGDTYVGEWLEDNIEGEGIYSFEVNSTLTGLFKENKFTFGKYKWVNNNGKFTISIKENSENTIYIIYDNGITYDGYYSDNDLNGWGKMTYPDIGFYTGNFLYGKKSGLGEFYWDDKEIYSGQWMDDKMNGDGLYIYIDGSTLTGNFSNNVPKGKLIYTKYGFEYITEWEDGNCISISAN